MNSCIELKVLIGTYYSFVPSKRTPYFAVNIQTIFDFDS